MHNGSLINQQSKKHGLNLLNKYYSKNFIPPEKKEYITSLEKSVGPYMGIEAPNGETHFLLDAASQIATLGLGFNPEAFFGTLHHQESWGQITETQKMDEMRTSFEALLKRELNWPSLATTFCHSGAEANEIAMGYCYKRRVNPKAKKILAFEGSFHGRMQISLSSTWNKAKREPFEWNDYLTSFVPFPNTKSDRVNVNYNKDWCELWESSGKKDISKDVLALENTDEFQKIEIDSLLKVREQLMSKEIFAIVIEPMQCEGGDQYATDRFYAGLLLLAQAYRVPVIFDEVQTGYHLGRTFFWQNHFQLKNSLNENIFPDYIVCAKKAQIGLVISHCDEKINEEFQASSFIRGMIHASALNQSKKKINSIETNWRERLGQFIKKFEMYYSNPRGLGLAFAFDVKDPAKVAEIISKRFDYGLLYYPAGAHTLRFRLNTAFSENDINFLFDHLEAITLSVFENRQVTPKPLPFDVEKKEEDVENLYQWHRIILDQRFNSTAPEDEQIDRLFNLTPNEKIVEINEQNFPHYAPQISELQNLVYEPARRTSIDIFEKMASHKDSICIVIEEANQIKAISFSGPVHLFEKEKGLNDHKDLNNPLALYTADTTITPSEKGRSFGRNLKYLTVIKGLEKGKKIFIGRNRDQHASRMYAINLSLGAYEYKYVKNDYNDDSQYRDVLHYIIDYSDTKIKNKSHHYLAEKHFDSTFDRKNMSLVINKICLSNFVGESFLKNLEQLMSFAPDSLKQGYSASGQSEAVDKIVKSIWTKDKKSNRFLTFEGHYFGHGSFCSRTLSDSKNSFFEVDRLSHPTDSTANQVMKQLEDLLAENEYIGVWIEPTRQKFMDHVSIDSLNKIREITTKYNTPLILNETGSKLGVYANTYYAANKMISPPDAIMCYQTGQFASINISKNYYLDKPLMLISTWDGDEYSLEHAIQKANIFSNDQEDQEETRKQLTKELSRVLENYGIDCQVIERGVGNFYGELPPKFRSYTKGIEGRKIVNLSHTEMRNLISLIKEQ